MNTQKVLNDMNTVFYNSEVSLINEDQNTYYFKAEGMTLKLNKKNWVISLQGGVCDFVLPECLMNDDILVIVKQSEFTTIPMICKQV